LNGGWRLDEFDPIEILVSVVALFGLALIIAFPFKGDGRLRLALVTSGAMLWIPFVLPGGVARLSVALLDLSAWFPAAKMLIALHGWDEKLLRETRDPLLKFLAVAAAGFVLLLPASGFSAAALLSYAGALSGSVLVVVALALHWGRAHRPRRRRKKFEPVPILRPGTSPSRAGLVGVFLVIGAICLVALIATLRSVSVPTPLPVFGARDFSWQSLARLGREKRARQLPDISSLVAHQAYQETISFGRPWGLPYRDERVYVRVFSINPRAGTIVPGKRRVKVFDSTWLSSVLRFARQGSIEQLLVSQHGARAVALRGQVRTLLREIPLAVLVIFSFSMRFAWDLRATPLKKSVFVRLNDAKRRSQVS
jgi:hypothetical protein